MDTQVKSRPGLLFLEKDELRRRMDAIDERLGIVPGPPVSLEELYARQRALGIRPEDRFASRELYRMRYGANWKEDWPDI